MSLSLHFVFVFALYDYDDHVIGVTPWNFDNLKSMFNAFLVLFDYLIALDELRCYMN